MFFLYFIIHLVNETEENEEISFLSIDKSENSSYNKKKQEKELLDRLSNYLESSQNKPPEVNLIKNEANNIDSTSSIVLDF